MKKGIHPHYHPITLVLTDGTEIETRSTWGKEGDKMYLEIDHKSHPAWTKVHRLMEKGQLARFNQRFQGIGTFGVTSSPKKED